MRYSVEEFDEMMTKLWTLKIVTKVIVGPRILDSLKKKISEMGAYPSITWCGIPIFASSFLDQHVLVEWNTGDLEVIKLEGS